MADVVLLAMEIVKDDESDDGFDSAFALAACKLLCMDRNRISGYTDEVTRRYFDFQFKKLFRLSRGTFDYVCERFRRSSFNQTPCVDGAKYLLWRLLIALTYLGNQSGMNSVANQFDMTESSVVLCLRRVWDFLLEVSAQVITWPNDAQMPRSKASFLAKSCGKGP